jgi:hypothetical protein
MVGKNNYTISDGFPPSHNTIVAALFWDAFKNKLGLIMKPEAKALQFLEMVADPSHAISAVSSDGTLLG